MFETLVTSNVVLSLWLLELLQQLSFPHSILGKHMTFPGVEMFRRFDNWLLKVCLLNHLKYIYRAIVVKAASWNKNSIFSMQVYLQHLATRMVQTCETANFLDRLVSLQHLATRMVEDCRGLSSEECLEQLSLFSIAHQRLRGDSILCSDCFFDLPIE